MKTLTYIIIGLILFAAVYATIIFTSDFGIPDTMDYQYNYPCETGLNKYEGGYVFENCYVLKIPFYDEELR